MSKAGLKPFIVPIFLPHQGCPHRCIFCDQRQITSQDGGSLGGAEVTRILNQALKGRKTRPAAAEAAFYGGTFTRLPISRMVELLSAVAPFLLDGRLSGVRISTRPDALDPGRLEMLTRYGVRTVELGAQSMNPDVLRLAGRGHGPEATRGGVRALRAGGFKVGIQLMPGLPGDTAETFRATVEEVVGLRPDMARLYPAIVLEGTGMADWYRQGRYQPWGLGDAVDICAEACRRLEANGIPVIRMGLMTSPSLLEEGCILAGPWHPAFGYLVRSALYRQAVQGQLACVEPGGRIKIMVPPREIPLLRGFRNQGLRWVEERTGSSVVAVLPADDIPPGQIKVVEA